MYSAHLLYDIKESDRKRQIKICVIVRFVLRWKKKRGNTGHLQIRLEISWPTSDSIITFHFESRDSQTTLLVLQLHFFRTPKYLNRESENLIHGKKKKK